MTSLQSKPNVIIRYFLTFDVNSADFFIYNNYKNYIINNKSDKIKILNLEW
jgi:hypothetical protein